MPPLCSKLRHIAHVVSDRSWDACVPIEGDPRRPALRRGSSRQARSAAVMLICHTQLHRASANPQAACKLISRLNLPGSRCACEPLGGLGPAGGAHIHFRWITELRCGLFNVRATVILFTHFASED